ncbi:MAG: hypothetical protein HOH65_17375 [Rhodospirillaceae bacterium]|nr:hypothetical protein [Rhodospirillaceae bacterium]
MNDIANDTENFARAMRVLLALEGGASDHPADPGGYTKYGLASRWYPQVLGPGFDLGDAEALYRDRFWDRLRCPDMPWELAAVVFLQGVNQGRGTVAKRLQRALGGLVDDGAIGPATIGVVRQAEASERTEAVARDLIGRLHKRYAETANHGTFGRGWHNRLVAVQVAAFG